MRSPFLLLLAFAITSAEAAQFHRLPKRPGDLDARVFDLSADGGVAVGFVADEEGTTRAAAWHRSRDTYTVHVLEEQQDASFAMAVSENGNVVVGSVVTASGISAARWENGTMELAGDAGGGVIQSEAVAVSADGSIVVCNGGTASGQRAFLWSQAGGIEFLDALPGGFNYSAASCISGDGLVVGGLGKSATGTLAAVTWDRTGAVTPLGSATSSVAALSHDGSMVAGYARTANSSTESEAVVWDPVDGPVGLGDLPGWIFSSDIQSCSSDGSVLVGHAAATDGRTPCIWIDRVGPTKLADHFDLQFGLDVSTLDLELVVSISASGQQFGGMILNDDGSTDGWLADLNPIDLPESVLRISTDSTSGEVTLAWQSDSSETYQLESSPDCDDWQPLESGVAGTGHPITRTFPLGNDPRFFRLADPP